MNRSGLPQIVLIDEKREHQGIQGSYCWGDICVDYAIPSSRTKDFQEQLSILKGATISFKVLNHISPDQLHVTIFHGNKIVLHEALKTKLQIKIPKGIYFLNVKATWTGQGDVSNVFLIEVV